MVSRFLLANIQKRFNDNKAIILLGPRQVGKTTLLNAITDKYKNNFFTMLVIITKPRHSNCCAPRAGLFSGFYVSPKPRSRLIGGKGL